MSLLESQFQKKLCAKLDKFINDGLPLYYFVKEAKSIRGIPDLILCCNGHFVALELKRTQDEAEKTGGRIALQKYTLTRIQRAHGFGYLVYPENADETLKEIYNLCDPKFH